MSFIDNRGRLFGKINLIDFLLILVVLAAIAFGVYKLNKGGELAILPTESKKVTVEFYGNALYPFQVENMKEGDFVRTLDTNDVIGTIVSIKKNDAINLVSTADGRTVISKIPDKYSVYIEVQGSAKLANGILMAGNTPLLVGNEFKIKSSSFTMNSVISKVVEQ
ncbi:DUF4330 domain-containing protein [Brevibacillus sp. B_LB10_24]|uniref:DUF4330 domain-containing protein n=1 Tax=Brevibacillus sp. B_LB10_24 TaxID=3380645 RepID=UPI0038BCA523